MLLAATALRRGGLRCATRSIARKPPGSTDESQGSVHAISVEGSKASDSAAEGVQTLPPNYTTADKPKQYPYPFPYEWGSGKTPGGPSDTVADVLGREGVEPTSAGLQATFLPTEPLPQPLKRFAGDEANAEGAAGQVNASATSVDGETGTASGAPTGSSNVATDAEAGAGASSPPTPSGTPDEGGDQPSQQQQRQQQQHQHPWLVDLGFNDPSRAFVPMSTSHLIRAYLTLRACSIPIVARNADHLWTLGCRFLGERLTSAAVRVTFFDHFCGGETQRDLARPLAELRRAGLSAILDYAAEDDPDGEGVIEPRKDARRQALARTYDYSGEAACDANMTRVLSAIESAAKAVEDIPDGTPGSHGVVAVKLTALVKPSVLIDSSRALQGIKSMWFEHFATDGGSDARVTKEQFVRGFRSLPGTGNLGDDELEEIYDALDVDRMGTLDYIEWTSGFGLDALVTREHWEQLGLDVGKVFRTHTGYFLGTESTKLLDNMNARVNLIADRAASLGVKILIDAEHTYIQPAIDQVTRSLQLKHNSLKKPAPTVFNTYQCYLKKAKERVVNDLERARRANIYFAGKLVRGAYLYRENERAAELGTPSPILPSLEATHESYNWCLDTVLCNLNRAELVIATHNQYSIEFAVNRMAQYGICPGDSRVMFAQLYGMAEYLSLTLGREGYNVYKYVPYGPVKEVVPYLTRRAQENADLLGGVGVELNMLGAEIKSRLSPR